MHIVCNITLHQGCAAASWHWLGRISTQKLTINCLHPSKEHIYKIKNTIILYFVLEKSLIKNYSC